MERVQVKFSNSKALVHMKSEQVHEATSDSVTSSYNSPSTYPPFQQFPSMKN